MQQAGAEEDNNRDEGEVQQLRLQNRGQYNKLRTDPQCGIRPFGASQRNQCLIILDLHSLQRYMNFTLKSFPTFFTEFLQLSQIVCTSTKMRLVFIELKSKCRFKPSS
jgi:hypothetical protein